jgi:beta-catenin-like protein 1
LTPSSPHDGQERFLVKFLENECEKCDRLVELLLKYDEKTRLAEYKFYRENDVAEEDQQRESLAALDAKLRAGGDLFHRLGAIAAFVSVHSKTSHAHLLEQLTLQGSGIGVVKAAVGEFVSVLDAGDQRQRLQDYLEKI